MCEGQNEEVLLNHLLDADALCFTRDDLIGRRPYPVRQLSNPTIKSELKHYGLPVKVYRVGDKQNDKSKQVIFFLLNIKISRYNKKKEQVYERIINTCWFDGCFKVCRFKWG